MVKGSRSFVGAGPLCLPFNGAHHPCTILLKEKDQKEIMNG